MQYAYGMISPTITTNIVDIKMAAQAGTKICRNIGKASIAKELDNSKVDKSK